jgi:hypothetical protein
MASSKSTVGRNSDLALQYEKGVTLPSSATTEYSEELEFFPNKSNNDRIITVGIQASAVSGTNLDIGLYADFEEGGDKVLLSDTLVADVTDGTFAAGTVDLNEYPARAYYIGWTADADESANTIDWYVVG